LFAANILLKPFDRITSAINDIKAGFTNEDISVPDYLETEHIVTAFNQLQSRMKTLDESRQEFVSNVSHELKTPITSMKVLADTLVAQPDAPIEMYQDFMQDISKEVDREATIIDDLLSLVKMDKTSAQLNISTVDVNEMTEIILKRLRPIARKNNIELTFDSRRPVTAEIDEVKLSLAIMNIVENAIKYNKEQGWVKVILDADHQSFTITISDSGVGIPEDSTELIFNRFYRVDKSRSREIGGTGLGLSITKSAILMHRGSIDVDSVLGEGTTFTVTIPLSYAK
jgi:signal transduction histidine kinase